MKLGKKIAEGASSQIYEVADNPKLAIKVLKEQYADLGPVVRSFLVEAVISARVNHPGVLRILDSGMLGRLPYLVSERLVGEALSARIARGKLPVDQALTLMRSAASGLAAMHAAEVVHFDVKPDNIFLCVDGSTRILDFGIAVFPGLLRENDIGTPIYCAPECWLGGGNWSGGPASDVYSLGCVLYEMIRGKPPFVSLDAVELGGLHVDVVPDLVQEAMIVNEMLEKNPTSRPTMRELVADQA